MALGADPDYLFARLLHQACNEGLDPESIRRCLRAERTGRVPADPEQPTGLTAPLASVEPTPGPRLPGAGAATRRRRRRVRQGTAEFVRADAASGHRAIADAGPPTRSRRPGTDRGARPRARAVGHGRGGKAVGRVRGRTRECRDLGGAGRLGCGERVPGAGTGTGSWEGEWGALGEVQARCRVAARLLRSRWGALLSSRGGRAPFRPHRRRTARPPRGRQAARASNRWRRLPRAHRASAERAPGMPTTPPPFGRLPRPRA